MPSTPKDIEMQRMLYGDFKTYGQNQHKSPAFSPDNQSLNVNSESKQNIGDSHQSASVSDKKPKSPKIFTFREDVYNTANSENSESKFVDK